MEDPIDYTIRKIAYVIWQERKRRGDADADDAEKNWNLAKKRLRSPSFFDLKRGPHYD